MYYKTEHIFSKDLGLSYKTELQSAHQKSGSDLQSSTYNTTSNTQPPLSLPTAAQLTHVTSAHLALCILK